MKTAEPSGAAQTTQVQRKAMSPFAKKGEGAFFGKNEQQAFFDPVHTVTNTGTVQAKLSVGEPGDAYETEADAMADKVVQRLHEPGTIPQQQAPVGNVTPLVQRKCAECEREEQLQAEEKVTETVQKKPIFESNEIPAAEHLQRKCVSCEQEEKLQKKEEEDEAEQPQNEIRKMPVFGNGDTPADDDENIQRKCAACEQEDRVRRKEEGMEGAAVSPELENRLSSSAGNGIPLPEELNHSMGAAFGTDFSDVRIHHDSGAAQMSKELNAQAFTLGKDIYFNSGKYDTKSADGKRLLAHELTHVVQQGGTKSGNTAQPKLQRMPEWVSNAADWVSSTASETIDAAADGARWVGGKIADGAGAIKDAVEEGLSEIADTIKELVNSGIDWLKDKWTSIKEFASAGFDTLKNVFTGIVSFIKSPLTILANAIMNLNADSLAAAWGKFTGLVTEAWEGFKVLSGNLFQQANAVWNGISGFAGSLLNRVAALTQGFLFRKLPDALQRIVLALVAQLQSLWENIRSGWTTIIGKIQQWVNSALDTILRFVLRVTSFAIHVIVDGIRQFGKLVLFLKDLFSNPQKYMGILAKKSVEALSGVEARFSGIVQSYFGDSKKTAPAPAGVTGTIQRQPETDTPAETKRSASWSEIGNGIWAMMGKKWNEFKSNPWAVVTGLLMDMFLPMVGNVKDVIQLFKDIWKIVTGPLSAGSLEEVWTSFLQLLDIPILIYHTVVSILMRSLMLPLIVASFIPHPLVKAIAAAVGYGLLGEFVQVELINIGHKLLLLKTGATTKDQKQEAYNRIADSFIALAMTAVIIVIMLILHFLANVIKGVYNFVKGKVFGIETAPVEGKGSGGGEGKGGPDEGKGSGADAKGPKEGMPSEDGQRKLRINEEGKCEVCASPCDDIRKKYASVITPDAEARIKAIEQDAALTEAQKEAKLKPIEQELAEAKQASESKARMPSEIKWPPEPPKGEKPPVTAPDAAEWRYQRYAYEKYMEGATQKDILPPDEWMRRYFDPVGEGGRPGRPGGPEQVAAKKVLEGEGIKIVENVEVGGRYPDGIDPKPNAMGGKSYFEVGKMLESGIPEARERVKIGDEIKAMGPNDTVTFVDKTNPAKRVTYTKGSTPDNPTSKTF